MKALQVLIPMIVLAGQIYTSQFIISSKTEKIMAKASINKTVAQVRGAK